MGVAFVDERRRMPSHEPWELTFFSLLRGIADRRQAFT